MWDVAEFPCGHHRLQGVARESWIDASAHQWSACLQAAAVTSAGAILTRHPSMDRNLTCLLAFLGHKASV